MTSYNPTIWIDEETPVNAQNMNKIEGGIEQQNNDMFILSEYVVDLDNRVSNDIQTLSEYVVELNSDDIGYTTEADSSIKTIKDALDKILYTPLTISLSSNYSSLQEKGTTLNSVNFTWVYNKKVIYQTFENIELDISIRSYMYNVPITSNKTVTLVARDEKSSFSKNVSFSFIYPIYIGSVSTSTPSQTDIKNMTKRLVNPSTQSFTYSIDNKRMCICTPSNWNIKSIIDPNGFNITSTFTTSNINITCMDGSEQTYKLLLSEPTTQNNFIVKFNI